MPLRSRHPAGVLAHLPPAQRDALVRWLTREQLTRPEARARLQERFGVKTSIESLSNFRGYYCPTRRLRTAAKAAQAFPAATSDLGENWSAETRQLAQQKFFELLSAPETDPRQLNVFAALIAKIVSADNEREKLALSQQKFAAETHLKTSALALQREKFEFDATDAAIQHAQQIKTIAADHALSADEKREQLRRLLFPQVFAAPEAAAAPATEVAAPEAPPR